LSNKCTFKQSSKEPPMTEDGRARKRTEGLRMSKRNNGPSMNYTKTEETPVLIDNRFWGSSGSELEYSEMSQKTEQCCRTRTKSPRFLSHGPFSSVSF